MPVPNNKSWINWDEYKSEFRAKVLNKLEKKLWENIKDHILVEHMITTWDWERDYNVFLWATFNLSHKLTQMLYFRPHNQLDKNTYLVGGGTNPGSGLPTIYESWRIAANLIINEN